MADFLQALVQLLSGGGAQQPVMQAAQPHQGRIMLPQQAPIPEPRPATLPNGSFAPARVDDEQGPLAQLLSGNNGGFGRMIRAAGAGMANIGDSHGDPYVAFGRGFGGATGYADTREAEELKRIADERRLVLDEQIAKVREKEAAKSGAVSYGKTPVWGTDPKTGKTVIGVLGDDGSFKPVDTNGLDLSPGIEKLDAGTHWVIKDRRTGETIGTEPKENYQEAYDKGLGGENAKIDAAKPAMKSKAISTMDALDSQRSVVTSTLDKSISAIEANPSIMTGLVGGLASALPGTPAYDLAQQLTTIKANIGFDKLQQMRENSPTGGALGQVSDFENTQLQAVFGSLDQAQSSDQLLANLRQLKQILAGSRDARRRAYARDFGEQAPSDTLSNGDGLSREAPVVRKSGSSTAPSTTKGKSSTGIGWSVVQ